MIILNILRLKLLNLTAIRGLMILFMILPVLLGLVAGTSNMANQQPTVRLDVVDLEKSEASRELLSSLREQGWSVRTVAANEAQRDLLKHNVDGVITVKVGYEESLSNLDEVCVTYKAAEGSLLTTMVCEAIASRILPIYSRLLYLGQIADRYAAIGEPEPANLTAKFDQDATYFADHQARLDIIYTGAPVFATAQTYLVSDYSMEVFFLGIYAILGTLALSGSAFRRRLAATRHGLLLDYSLSIFSLFLLGLIQIILYTLAMCSLMKTPIRLHELGLLAICLLLVLGLGQLLNLIHDSLRLFLGLMFLLALSVGSGCFFQLSEKLITNLGQYLPQGWTLAALRCYPVLPAFVPIAAALFMLAAGYLVQVYRIRHAN
jgi:hypothetical protein